MPIYEYECLTCRAHFENLQRLGDLPLESCPHGHRRIRRVFSLPAVVFKGAGFYVTDNRPGKESSESFVELAADSEEV